MPGFLDRIKGEAEKAGFEAERFRRLNQAQGVLKGLQRDLERQTAAMGLQALALYDAGALTQPELVTACQQIDGARQRIADQQAQIERIRQEKPPEPVISAQYGHICPRCQIRLPDEVRFCPRCGTQAVDVAPPPPPSGQACAQCHAPLAPGALFCPQCGARVEAAAPAAPSAICPSCHTLVPPEAVFCPNCGAAVRPAAPEPPPAVEAYQAAAPAESEVQPPLAPPPDSLVCPQCQALNPPEALFCAECGAAVAPAPAQPQ